MGNQILGDVPMSAPNSFPQGKQEATCDFRNKLDRPSHKGLLVTVSLSPWLFITSGPDNLRKPDSKRNVKCQVQPCGSLDAHFCT